MIVAISYYEGDRELMKRWARHVEKLGPYPNHTIFVAPAHQATTEGVIEHLQGFGKVVVKNCWHTERGWPISCNAAFEFIGRTAEEQFKAPFLFMEPDAVPLCKGWIDQIEAEYKTCGKPFMGDFVNTQAYDHLKGVPNHMSGIAVYTNFLSYNAPSIFRNEINAWDIVSARDVVPKMHRTNLIQHDFDTKNSKWRKDNIDASCVKQGAVIYHPDKKGVLFNDGLSPNGVQGDPATGGDLVARNPHETKDILITTKTIPAGTPLAEEEAIQKAINILLFHASISSKNKKKITEWLCEKGLSAKAKKGAKRVGGKVRKNVGTTKGRSGVGGGTQIPRDTEVAV